MKFRRVSSGKCQGKFTGHEQVAGVAGMFGWSLNQPVEEECPLVKMP
jgi:hypothetical protein